MFAKVNWTETGIAKLKAKEYRYISSEISKLFRHPKTGKITRYVYMGAALTNIPHLMDITPIEMEKKSVSGVNENEPAELTVDKLLETLGVKTLAEAIDMFSAKEKENKKESDEVAELKKRIAEKDKLIADLAKQEAESKIKAQLTSWSKGEKFSLPEVTLTKLGKFVTKLDAAELTVLTEIVDELLTTGLVDSEEDGASNVVALDNKNSNASIEFTNIIADIQKEKKCSYEEAFNLAKIQNPKLANKYLEFERGEA